MTCIDYCYQYMLLSLNAVNDGIFSSILYRSHHLSPSALTNYSFQFPSYKVTSHSKIYWVFSPYKFPHYFSLTNNISVWGFFLLHYIVPLLVLVWFSFWFFLVSLFLVLFSFLFVLVLN